MKQRKRKLCFRHCKIFSVPVSDEMKRWKHPSEMRANSSFFIHLHLLHHFLLFFTVPLYLFILFTLWISFAFSFYLFIKYTLSSFPPIHSLAFNFLFYIYIHTVKNIHTHKYIDVIVSNIERQYMFNSLKWYIISNSFKFSFYIFSIYKYFFFLLQCIYCSPNSFSFPSSLLSASLSLISPFIQFVNQFDSLFRRQGNWVKFTSK